MEIDKEVLKRQKELTKANWKEVSGEVPDGLEGTPEQFQPKKRMTREEEAIDYDKKMKWYQAAGLVYEKLGLTLEGKTNAEREKVYLWLLRTKDDYQKLI